MILGYKMMSVTAEPPASALEARLISLPSFPKVWRGGGIGCGGQLRRAGRGHGKPCLEAAGSYLFRL